MAALEIKSRPLAVGYLEMLWHFTAEFAPQGDIGRYSDDRIEGALDWSGKRGRLVEALTTSGWVDLDASTRLFVHDWEDHADAAVAKKLKRAGLQFLKHTPKVTGQNPPMSATQDVLGRPALPLPEPCPALPLPPAPQVSPGDWPETADAVKCLDPAANGIFLERLVRTTIQAALSDGRVNMRLVNDKSIAAAVIESVRTGPKNHKAGLLLNRVPEIIVTWGHDG